MLRGVGVHVQAQNRQVRELGCQVQYCRSILCITRAKWNPELLSHPLLLACLHISPFFLCLSRAAESLLESQPLGTFLIRVSHSHVGYTLSYK